jgi:chromosomal replication initiator protein
MFEVEQKFLQTLEQRLSREKYTAYGAKLRLKSFTDGLATLEVPNIFIKKQVHGQDHQIIFAALSVHLPNLRIIESTIAEEAIGRRTRRRQDGGETIDWTKTTIGAEHTTTARDHMTGLNPKYQLQNFVVGSNSDVAYNAALAVIDQPGSRYNPLYIYGGVGIGKTHLIQAVGNEIVRRQPKMRVKYITMEIFYRDFIEAIRKKVNDWAQKYRNVDVLIVDDIQFIEGKEKSQEQFFHTFNDLQQEGKQIIISSDRHPSTISGLTDRLLSRFTQGLIIDIQTPDLETRCAIIEAKTASMGFSLDSAITEKIAEYIRSNVRELEGVLNKLQLETARGRLITVGSLDQLLMTTTPTRTLSPKIIIKKTADFFHLSLDEITSESRSKHILEPRQIAMYLLRTELNLSLPKIATEFHKKDHTPVLNAMRKLDRLLSTDLTLRTQVNQIKESLHA